MLEKKNNKRSELSDIGEFGLIDYLTKDIKLYNSTTIKGVGDDAAVISIDDERVILVSTDLLAEGIHFDMVYTPLKHLGYKAAVVNFSDIFAMNATPKQLLVSLAISNRYSVEALEELYQGIKYACERYKVDLVGGDTTSSQSGLVISMTIIGEAQKEEVVYRSGAKENDLVCVSGNLGAAYIGLLVLECEKQVFKTNPEIQPDLDGNDYVLQRQLKPEAKAEIIKSLKENSIIPTAMIDISDGLASDILHICKQSNKGCQIYEEKIPIDAQTALLAEGFNIVPTVAAMNGGEDYELLFTIKQSDYEKIVKIKNISIIGHITDVNSGVNIISNNNSITITAQGWDGLKNK